jgi:hypothetical protein
MATNPALVARTTLVAEEPWKAVLRRKLEAVTGALDRRLPLQPLNRSCLGAGRRSSRTHRQSAVGLPGGCILGD